MKKGNFRKKKFGKKRKNTYKIFFLIVIGMTLGYAAINTTLQLIGTLNISRTTWDIHWENPTKVGGVNATKEVTLKTGDNTTVEYQVNLTNPGDYYEFTVDAVNSGTIDAMITNYENKVYENNVEISTPTFLEFNVVYADTESIANNHLLAAGSRETYRIKVMYKNGLSADQLPTSTSTYKFTFDVSYMQADEDSQVVKYKPGDLVYFDPVSENICNASTFDLEKVNNNESTCYKWRVLTIGDTFSNTNVVVQLDHDLYSGPWVTKADYNDDSTWPSAGNTSKGPITLLNSLATATSTWVRVPLLNYVNDSTGAANSYGVLTCTNGTCATTNGGTIATGVRARVIDGKEVRNLTLTINDDTSTYAYTWNEGTSASKYYYFSSDVYTIGTKDSTGTVFSRDLYWLVENTGNYSSSGGTANVYGEDSYKYWSLSLGDAYNESYVWRVNYSGDFNFDGNNTQASYGVRPVIDIEKAKLK